MANTNKTVRINKEGQKVDQEQKVDKKEVKLSSAAQTIQIIVREELGKAKNRFVDLAKVQGYSEADSEKIGTNILDQFTANKWSSLAWSRSTRKVKSKSQLIKDILAGKDVQDAPQEVLEAIAKLKEYL